MFCSTQVPSQICFFSHYSFLPAAQLCHVPKSVDCCSPSVSLLPPAYCFALSAMVCSFLSLLAECNSAPDLEVTTTAYYLPRNSRSASLSLHQGNHCSTLKSGLGTFFLTFTWPSLMKAHSPVICYFSISAHSSGVLTAAKLARQHLSSLDWNIAEHHVYIETLLRCLPDPW